MAGPKTPKHAPSKAAVPPPAPPPPPAPSSTKTASATALWSLWGAYLDTTPARLKFVDSFLVFLVLSGVIQFVYCVLVTSFPFNAFLAGFASTVGQFVLTASLRSQVNAGNRALFKDVSPERAFADFVVGSVILHFFVFNFLG
ncbi:DAD family-domain-containing protein [Lactifluus subvellereus]|nr:DAD family-domain-containing protein [Lactifluus subvellereus]